MIAQQIKFLKGFVENPRIVGSVVPSSGRLADALCEPYRRFGRPARILEVGAGTGPITRHLGSILGEEDELDVCEIHAPFANILRQEVLAHADFSAGVAQGRIRLLEQPVQDIAVESHYDFVISGLPLTAFELADVESVFQVLRKCLKNDGVLSYFEYVGLRRTSRTLAMGAKRQRIRSVSRFLSDNIRRHQFASRMVYQNFPPARARYLRFGSG